MKLTYINDQRRDGCLACLCAAVHGQQAGLTPLVEFAGLDRLLDQESARIVALVDEAECPLSLALLVLDVEGQGLSLRLLATPEALRGHGYARELVTRLAATTAMRVTTREPHLEAFFKTFGFTRWCHADDGARVGFNERAGVHRLMEAPETVDFSAEAVTRAFKRDNGLFEDYKQRFVTGLESLQTGQSRQ
ncbi:hypothetical protein C7446_2363 [Kushneria sinocarnis]|uniref:N-acetyltransferase domain-containing protein n=1 Tax=Kushneria sinocarnis TaxID=595502 RepID=A0A420WVQ6_9GAMM|nr:hypothetical protein [Kushneria sinocarnis]RKR02643.1 hypothetical protein C7446_2363 [Kushneria sinocarnis]